MKQHGRQQSLHIVAIMCETEAAYMNATKWKNSHGNTNSFAPKNTHTTAPWPSDLACYQPEAQYTLFILRVCLVVMYL